MIIESSNGGSEKEAAWMVGMTLYICLEWALVCPHGRKSQKRRRAVTRYGLVRARQAYS
jgi:hypothetical protein